MRSLIMCEQVQRSTLLRSELRDKRVGALTAVTSPVSSIEKVSVVLAAAGVDWQTNGI
jgi:hypothetical protein